MNTLYYCLKFPDYFGANWDALVGVLHDTDWVTGSTLVIQHQESPKNLLEKDLFTYLDILSDAIEFHKKGPNKNFQLPQRKIELRVLFPEDVKQVIERLSKEV